MKTEQQNKYQLNKARARESAINWQLAQMEKSTSLNELIDKQNHFRKLAKKYGLVKEFKENGII